MWPNPQEAADLVTFTEEILDGKLHLLCSDTFYGSVLEKKKAFNGNIGDPFLKRKTHAPARYYRGKGPDEHPTTPKDN